MLWQNHNCIWTNRFFIGVKVLLSRIVLEPKKTGDRFDRHKTGAEHGERFLWPKMVIIYVPGYEAASVGSIASA